MVNANLQTTKPHILLLASFFPTPNRPSIGIFFQQQAQALQRAGYQVGVLVTPRIRASIEHTRRAGQLPNLRTATFEEYAGLPVYRLHWGWFPRIFPEVCAWLIKSAGWPAFERYVAEQGRPDIIHGHNIFYSGYLATHLGRAYSIPAVVTEHSSNFLRGRIFLPGQHRIAREVLQNSDHFFTVSAALADKLQRYTPNQQIEILGNVVDLSLMTLPLTSSSDGYFTFAAVAQLKERLKRFDLLLDAFAHAFSGHQQVRLKIGGDGPLRFQLERQVEALGLQEQVEFLGELDRNGVRDLFQNAQVIVSSSEVETFGITLIEAMACGKPVVATKSGGPQDFVTYESGLLVPVNDVEALTATLIQIRDNYHSYDPSHIRDSCIERFSEQAIVSRLNVVYNRLIDR